MKRDPMYDFNGLELTYEEELHGEPTMSLAHALQVADEQAEHDEDELE